MKKLFFIFSFILLTACQTEKNTKFSIDDFKDLGDAHFIKKIKFEEYAYSIIYSIDKNFNLAKLVNSDYVFAILDDDLNLVKKIIKKEPDLNIPQNLHILDASLKGNNLLLTFINNVSNNSKLLLDYNLKNEKLSIKEDINFEEIEFPYISYIYTLNDGNYITNCSNLDDEIDFARIYNKNFEVIKRLPLNFMPEKEDLGYIWYNFNPTFLSRIINVPNNHYLISISKIKQLILVDEELNIVRQLNTPFKDFEINDIINNANKKIHFSIPLVTSNHIIIPYYVRVPDTDEVKNTKLLFYSHELEPLHSINLNIPNTNVIISVSKDESKLYVINFTEEEVYIYDKENIFNIN